MRRLARSSRDAKQVRRLLAVATIYDGESRSEAARIGGVTLQIVRDWVVRSEAGDVERLITLLGRPLHNYRETAAHIAGS